MKRQKFDSPSTQFSVAFLVVVFATSAIATPPDPTDPDLRLWLRADDLAGAVGSEVTDWEDASLYGTIFAPPGPRVIGIDSRCPESPADRGPTLVQEVFPGNPNPVPALLFQVTGGFTPVLEDGTECEPDFETCCFLSNPDSQQRLYQQNNLLETGGFDPLNIGNGTGLTTFVVYKPVLVGESNDQWPGGVQTIFAKRGTNECVYSMGLEGRTGTNNVGNDRVGNLILVQYDSVESYNSDLPLKGNVWHISSATIDDNDAADNDEVTLFTDDQEDSSSRVEQLNEPITTVRRGGTVPEPFGIGGHSQQCCGAGERLHGLICEIIVFARRLDATEFEGIQDYLNLKYFSPLQPPKSLKCSRSPDGSVVDLTWENMASYDSIKVQRNGVDIATVASDSTSFQDTGVPEGEHSYRVIAEIGGLSEGPVCGVLGPVRFSTPDPADPTLRLWLRGSDLVPQDDPNPDNSRQMVTEWLDASSYGTRLRVRRGDGGFENPDFEPGVPWIVGDEPTYLSSGFPGNPNAMPVVRFDVAGPPVLGNQDRLVQDNNLGVGDPLDVGDGSGLTVVAVYNPLIAGTPELGFQTILGKRGTNSSVYTLGIHGGAADDPKIGHLNYVTYAGPTEYVSSEIIAPNTWHITFMTVEEAGANDILNFFDADGETLSQTLTKIGGPILVENRNPTTPEPFYLGGHAQECCGDGERFAGGIAEIMIFARTIEGAERDEIFGYLNAKYFSANQPPEGLVCSRTGDGTTVDLSWTSPVTYDGIVIERDGVEIASLAGDATSYQDAAVPVGSHTYAVVAAVGSLSGGPKCTAKDPAGSDVRLAALTFFGTDDVGTVRISERWNTQFPDAAWDVGVLEGPVVDDPSAYATPSWLTDAENGSLDITLVPGQTRTFTFVVARIDTFPNWFGLNLFFNDAHFRAGGGEASISVFGFLDDDGLEGEAPFAMANSADLTMGWPIADTIGSGSLVYEEVENNVRVTLTDYVAFNQSALNAGAGIDVVQAQGGEELFTTGGTDDVPDLFGQFTIKVSKISGGGTSFRRGDCDQSGKVDFNDAIFHLRFLFLGENEDTVNSCKDACDSDDSGADDFTDDINTLKVLFLGQGSIPEPGPLPDETHPCGEDPTKEDPEELTCDAYVPEIACP